MEHYRVVCAEYSPVAFIFHLTNKPVIMLTSLLDRGSIHDSRLAL